MSDPTHGFRDPGERLADASSRYGFSGGDILHPSDLTVDEGRAFAHAMALALRLRSALTLLHAGPRARVVDGLAFPHVRETLVRWGLLDPGSGQDAVFDELGVEVRKIGVKGSALHAIEQHLETRPTDFVVMATSGRKGLPGWMTGSVSERFVRSARVRTLFVPRDVEGFVSLEDGSIRLRRIVVPLDARPDPRVGLLAAPRLAQLLGQDDVEFIAVHVGDGRPPDEELPDERWSWELRPGTSPGKEILAVAGERRADCIVMATEGRHGMLEVLRGSTTAQVLHHAPCALAALPAQAYAEPAE